MAHLTTYEELENLGLIHKFQEDYNPFNSAKARSAMSGPLKDILKKEYIKTGDKVLDFGSGKLRDVYDLINHGVKAKGYDPYADYYSKEDKSLLEEEYDAVIANFVFDVIKDRCDHRKTMKIFRNIKSKRKFIAFDNRFFSKNKDWKFDKKNKTYFTGVYYQRYYRSNDYFIWFGKHELVVKNKDFVVIEIL